MNLLSLYRLWGMTAIASFAAFIFLIVRILSMELTPFYIFVLLLISGFAWIGATVMSRHTLILLKQYIRKRVGMVEFLSTQFVVLLFPFAYIKVKKESEKFLAQIEAGEE